MISKFRFLIAASCFIALSFQVSAAPKTIQVHLEGIADGDTIYVRSTKQNASYRVRLAMIDAPEKNQAYGQQAKLALQQLLRGAGLVTLHIHSTDRYGRLIAVVEDDRKRNINLLLVNQGAAWVYSQYAKQAEFASYYPVITTAEHNARMQRIGLWADADPIEPWRFRRAK